MTLVEVEPGVRIHAQDLGEGPPVVIVAGFGLGHPVWDGEVEALTSAGHRVVCIDLRGTCGSDKPLTGYDVPRHSADVIAVLDALELQDVTYIGWSFGGQVGLHAVGADPARFRRLVLVNSGGVRASRSERYPFGPRPEPALERVHAAERGDRILARFRMMESAFASPPDSRVMDFLMGIQLQMPSWAALATLEAYLTTDLCDVAESLPVPVTQIVGDSDLVTPMRGAQWLDEHLPDSELLVLPGCGHYPMFEAATAFRHILVRTVDGWR